MSDKPRLLVIAGYTFIPPVDGGKRCIYYFNNYLAAHFDIEIITTNDNEHGEETFRLNGLLGNSRFRYINPFLFFSLRKKIKREKIKLLMLEQCYFGWLGIALKLFSGVKLVIHHHNIEGLRFRSLQKWWAPLMYMYEQYVCRFADMNFFITREDAEFAQEKYKVQSAKISVAPYGVTVEEVPSASERSLCRQALINEYGLNNDTHILLFAAAYNYGPNLDALKLILDKINPLLLGSGFTYKIIICGGGLPDELNKLKPYSDKNIIYAGFVKDISMYYKAAEVFLNPVTEGGGIKTKIVEALSLGTTVVSMKSGAAGVDPAICGNKLFITPDSDAQLFFEGIKQECIKNNYFQTPVAFYNFFSWKKIAESVKGKVEELFI